VIINLVVVGGKNFERAEIREGNGIQGEVGFLKDSGILK